MRLITAAAAYDEGAVAVFIEFTGGFIIVCRHLNGIHDMAVTIILVIAHINQDGVFMIDQADRLARRYISDLAQAVPEFDTRKHGEYGNKCRYQKKMISCKFTELVYVHGTQSHIMATRNTWRFVINK